MTGVQTCALPIYSAQRRAQLMADRCEEVRPWIGFALVLQRRRRPRAQAPDFVAKVCDLRLETRAMRSGEPLAEQACRRDSGKHRHDGGCGDILREDLEYLGTPVHSSTPVWPANARGQSSVAVFIGLAVTRSRPPAIAAYFETCRRAPRPDGCAPQARNHPDRRSSLRVSERGGIRAPTV